MIDRGLATGAEAEPYGRETIGGLSRFGFVEARTG